MLHSRNEPPLPALLIRRIAIAGSIRAARSAGIQHATIPIAAISTATPANVTGSRGSTPNNSPWITRAP
jgi:hypothetical protein